MNELTGSLKNLKEAGVTMDPTLVKTLQAKVKQKIDYDAEVLKPLKKLADQTFRVNKYLTMNRPSPPGSHSDILEEGNIQYFTSANLNQIKAMKKVYQLSQLTSYPDRMKAYANRSELIDRLVLSSLENQDMNYLSVDELNSVLSLTSAEEGVQWLQRHKKRMQILEQARYGCFDEITEVGLIDKEQYDYYRSQPPEKADELKPIIADYQEREKNQADQGLRDYYASNI